MSTSSFGPEHPNKGWTFAIPEPFWVRSWRTLWRNKPHCLKHELTFKNSSAYDAHWLEEHKSDGYDECWCGFQTDIETVHRVFEVQRASDLIEGRQANGESFRLQRGEGTAVSADFCAEHCPGKCDRGCEERDVQLPYKKLEN